VGNLRLMGNFDDTKPKTKEEILKYAIESLEDAHFSFACFVDAFKRYIDGNDTRQLAERSVRDKGKHSS